MNINATLFGQMITFALFVWFTARYVWPPLMKALEERQKKIAEGIAASEKSTKELEQTRQIVAKQLKEAKEQASVILDEAQKRRDALVEEARTDAKEEGERLIESAKSEITQELNAARKALREELSGLVILGAEKLLKKNLDASAQEQFLSDILTEIESNV